MCDGTCWLVGGSANCIARTVHPTERATNATSTFCRLWNGRTNSSSARARPEANTGNYTSKTKRAPDSASSCYRLALIVARSFRWAR